MSHPIARSSSEEPTLEWSFNPWRERPAAAVVGVLIALALCLFVVTSGLHWLISLALCLVGVAAMAPLYAPARCRLDAAGAAKRGPFGWSGRDWSDIRRAQTVHAGLVVSPYSRPNLLDPYRSLFLPFPANDRALLVLESRKRLERHDLAH